ncbi:serine proteinase stubble isoform X3 [Cotesia glomerata]|uniref:serine proteinase stubble isoform X3 n=1 Tax=Cotesia glomerata TaxID=32391 RepID=UPI001D010B19|nr:serine proteinase stubble isoform X3 [Cotesia glomerata]
MAARGGFIWINIIAINILVKTIVAGPLYPQLITNGNGRNIRHLPCVSLRTGETGVCMFAFNCVKANGTHLGTCLDRFYFGSCCKLSDEPYVSPQDNAIEDLPSIQSVQSTPVFLSTGKPIESNDIPDIKIKPKPNPESFPSSTGKPSPSPSPLSSSPSPSSSSSSSTTRLTTKLTTKLPSTITKSPPTQKTTIRTTTTTTTTRPSSISTPYTTTQPSVFSTFQTVQDVHETYTPITLQTTSKPFTSTTTDRNPPGTRFPPRNATTSSSSSSPRPTTLKITTLKTTTSRPATKRPSTTKRPIKKPISTTPKPSSTNSTFAKPSKPSKPPTTATFTKKPADPIKTTVKPIKLSTTLKTTTEKITTTEKLSSTTSVPTTLISSTTTVPTTTTTTTTSLKITSTEVQNTTELETTERSSTPGFITWSSNSDEETTKFPTSFTASTTTTTMTTTEAPATTTAIPSSSSTSNTTTTQLEEVTEPEWSPITTPDGWIMIQSPSTEKPGNENEPVITNVIEPKPTKIPSTVPELVELTTEASTIQTTQPPVSTADSGASTISISTFKPDLDSGVSPETAAAWLNMSDFKQVCGRRLFPESRIVGGEGSSYGKWPWQISLRQWRTGTFLHKCGAALLNENWAITAAHCVENVPPGDLLLRMGEHDLANENEPYGYQERRVQIVASHPQFDPRTFEYDLALLRFYEPLLPFQPNLLPICLPDDDEGYVGHTAYVTGWGRLYDEGPLPSVLQEVPVPVINNSMCEGMYRNAGYNEHIPNIFICAGWRNGGFDSCEGDSGGPMVIQRPRDKRWILAGVISWGIGCAEPNQPGVYTRISEFREWINQILQF